MARLDFETKDFDRLLVAMKEYQGDTEKAINDVLHNEAGQLIHDEIYRLIPVSGRKPWKGKKKAASSAKSLRIEKKENLSVTVRTTYNYHYLYFPDDGTTTQSHIGNQQFFKRGGESQAEEIINRCITRLANDFENAQ